MQKAIPADVKGVPVSIDGVNAQGSPIHIADVTTDMSGTFGYMWKPEATGQYTITATFMGDDSYGSSWAQTYVGVVEAPETPTPTQQIVTLPPIENYFIGTTAAIVIAIAIVGVLMLRKRS
jgi:hypothetical protein